MAAEKLKFKNILYCDKCGSHNVRIYNSRESDGIRWRARECSMCGNRFFTYEIRKEDLDDLIQRENCKKYLMRVRDVINKMLEKM